MVELAAALASRAATMRTALDLDTAALEPVEEFATAAEGALAGSALQAGAPVSDLAETPSAKIMTAAERTKLAGIASDAQNVRDVSFLEINQNGVGDRNAGVDFIASGSVPGSPDYSARIARGPGVNGALSIEQTGTGGISISGGVANFSDRPTVDGSNVALQSDLAGNVYKGSWDASANSPTIVAGAGAGGDYYIVAVAGTQSITGSAVAFSVGDQARFNGTAWERIPNFAAVNSVAGKTGAVELSAGDIGDLGSAALKAVEFFATAAQGGKADGAVQRSGATQFDAGALIRFAHPNETNVADGTIGAGTYSDGLNIVGSRTLTTGGRVIRLYGEVKSENTDSIYLHTGNISSLMGLRSAASKDAGRDIGDVLTYEDYVGIPTVQIASKILFRATAPTVADAWSARFYRDASSLTGGTPGYVNTALTVDTDAGAGETAFEWNALFMIHNHADAGENVAAFFQATKYGQGQTWGGCFETREVPGATYGALVGIENALSANGPDPSGIRVIADVIGARYDDNQAIPTFTYGVRVNAAWNGSGTGVESAYIERPFHASAFFTGPAFSSQQYRDFPAGVNTVTFWTQHQQVDGGNTDYSRHYSLRDTTGAGWINTSLVWDRVIDTTVTHQMAFQGNGNIRFFAGGESFYLRDDGTIKMPVRSTDPSSPEEGMMWLIAASGSYQIRSYLGGAVRYFVPV